MTDQQPPAAAQGPGAARGPSDAPPSDMPPGGGGRRAAQALLGIRRDREQKVVAGVCAGLGRHCDIDPVIFRVVLAVLSVTGGLGLIFYGVAWLALPYADDDENEARRLLSGRVDGPALTAVLCALVGCGLLLSMLNNAAVLSFGATLALLLAGAGYWSRQRSAPDPDPLAAQAAADAPPEAQAPPVVASAASWWRGPIVKDGTHVGGTGYLWGPSTARDVAAAMNIARGRRPPGRPERAPAETRGPRWIGGLVFLLAVAGAALGTGLTWDREPLGTSLETGLACALGAFGVGIALSAMLGRTGGGSIVLAVITAGLLTGAAALPDNVTTDWMRTTWSPSSASGLHRHYDLGTGVGTLDLRRLKPQDGATLTSEVKVGVGRAKIVIPKDMAVRLYVHVGVGDIQLPGDDSKDVDVAPGKEKRLELSPPAGMKSHGTVSLRVDVGIGQAEVTRDAS
ncbi:PspC domain-containing protein [Streptomyces sp. NPDC050560]|uniref:PspC domain-containing protein n=1 Tax=Streptomyces sp. NPDC050560 TaxID=3365630 RepID=UPI0037945509